VAKISTTTKSLTARTRGSKRPPELSRQVSLLAESVPPLVPSAVVAVAVVVPVHLRVAELRRAAVTSNSVAS
jgi:hypothetical protein